MHSNPFSNTGYDLTELRGRIDRKADKDEIHSLRGDVDRLERANRELRSDIDGLRQRSEDLAQAIRETNPGLNV